MRAIRPPKHGGPDLLTLSELPTPTPGPGQALIEAEAIGVNFIDVYHRTGLYPTELPVPLGQEGAGTVRAVGPGVSGVHVGQRVAWSGTPGSYATHVLANAERLVPIPDGVDARVACAALLQGLTAHYLTTDCFRLSAGHTALVHAAAGGTGALVVQLAKRAGARVIGTVSSEEKAQRAREAGADEVLLYTRVDVTAEARRLTAGEGVDVVYDSVGLATYEKSLASLRPRGYLVLFGQSSGAVPPIDPLSLSRHGSLFLTRPTLAHYTRTRAELLARAEALFALVRTGELSVRIDRTFPLAQARAAHEALEGRRTMGKVLLLP